MTFLVFWSALRVADARRDGRGAQKETARHAPMPNPRCFHCNRDAPAASRTSLLLTDGSSVSDVPAKDMEKYAADLCDRHGPLCPGSDVIHYKCKRIINAVINAKREAPSVPTLRGKEPEYQPAPPRMVKMPTAAEKAAVLAEQGGSSLLPRRGSTTMMNMRLADLVVKAEDALSSSVAAVSGSGLASSSSPSSSAAATTATAIAVAAAAAATAAAANGNHVDVPTTKPKGTRKVAKEVSKFSPLSRVTATEDLRKHAVWRGKALNDALAKLGRQSSQYQEQKAKVGEQAAELKALRQSEQEARNALDAVTQDIERLEVYDEAAATLAEAGLSDIPFRFALNIANGNVSTGSIYARFMDDSMSCFEQATPYTRRLSEPVKKWLTYALTKQSPAVSLLRRTPSQPPPLPRAANLFPD